MGQKLPPDQLALYKRIDEILWHEWDPIGVNEISEARDEYRSYLPQIFRVAMENADVSELVEYLDYFTTESMGLPSDREHCRKVAEQIIKVRSELLK